MDVPETGASFERDLKELETIVEELEQGEASLEEALRLFEKGIKLVASCSRRLDEAEGKIQLLLEGQDGEPVLKPLENGDTE